MIEKLAKNLTRFYQISFVAVIVALLAVIFYFWKLGFIDGSRSKALHKAGYTLEVLQTNEDLNQISSLILSEKPKESVERVEELEKDMESLHALTEDESFGETFKELQRFKTSAANLISFQRSSKVLSVFNDKMEKFENFARENKWRTLTRMSQRVLAASSEPIAPSRLADTVKRIEKDFDSMVKITENSILSRADKSEIKSRIANLRVETSMLKKYLDERALTMSLAKSFKKSYAAWLDKISPELSFQKLQVERMGRYYVMGMLGILGLTSFLFFIGFLVNRWAFKKAQKSLEESFEEVAANSIIGRDELPEGLFSEEFQAFVAKTSDYVNKRMSFGAIFQDALPFSSVMLDKNLKVDWANRQFCDDWEISEDEASKDYMSWDYLAKLTNLGHDDPVLEALKNDVAGIYQIQVKPNEATDTRPYEMFVSPVKYNNQKKIMLFFYPLLSMRETIHDQAVSIVNPIDKTLRLMTEDAFEKCDKEQLRKEYEVGGISKMLDMFETLSKKRAAQRRELSNQIEALRGFLEKSQAASDQAYEVNAQTFKASKEGVKHLKTFKQGVVELSETAKDLEGACRQFNHSFKETLRELGQLQNDFGSLKNSVEDMTVSLPNLEALKEGIKENRAQAGESRARLGQALASFIHIKKGISHPEVVKKFQASYEKIYGVFEQMSSQYLGLEKRLVQLEVSLSKTQMIISSARKSSAALKSSQDFNSAKVREEKQRDLEELFTGLGVKSAESEALIVASLQSLYKEYKENLQRQALIAKNLELVDHAQFQETASLGGETTM